MNKKGFSLLEILLTLFVISSLTVLLISHLSTPNLDHIYFMNDYIKCQSEAICERENIQMNNSYGKSIDFNKDGKVNMGQTVDINNHKIVIHIGTGYPTYE